VARVSCGCTMCSKVSVNAFKPYSTLSTFALDEIYSCTY